MRSMTLVQMIEDHSEQIAGKVLRRVHQDPELPAMRRLPQSELKDRCQDVLKNLGHYLSVNKKDELVIRYETLGRRRFEESIPLHEVVRTLQILKESMIGFVRDQGVWQNSLELYAEEELQHRVGQFFDKLVYYVVRGYEEGIERASRRAS
jgi:hypothetical protein